MSLSQCPIETRFPNEAENASQTRWFQGADMNCDLFAHDSFLQLWQQWPYSTGTTHTRVRGLRNDVSAARTDRGQSYIKRRCLTVLPWSTAIQTRTKSEWTKRNKINSKALKCRNNVGGRRRVSPVEVVLKSAHIFLREIFKFRV